MDDYEILFFYVIPVMLLENKCTSAIFDAIGSIRHGYDNLKEKTKKYSKKIKAKVSKKKIEEKKQFGWKYY
uniref:Uncharacterized protein n=1 Tax=Parastrongyloides trichosuri TaxID=131310 RepID=A0A0N4Z4A0_PARTI